ncbi:hypothetical protein [Methylobacterium sp. 88A]|uniref:hypothetical protein n=1 Tax=Methylobacterium sp. 88A TaxID=1131813 RepID=UPI00037AC6A7|nr:hypothetical protein [Methylobacterium sp. 88A]
MTELERRRLVVLTFVTSALEDDVPAFVSNLAGIDWPGAWLEIFTELAPFPRELVSDRIRHAFFWSWRGTDGLSANDALKGQNWELSKDLEDRVDLQVSFMKTFAPAYEELELTYVLYRGQWLSKHNAKLYGMWWTIDPVYASYFATNHFEKYSGQGAVLATVIPSGAIISKLNELEFLIDPSLLGEVHCIDVPPRYSIEECSLTSDQKDDRSRMIGIPNGYDRASLKVWIDQGMKREGLDWCRDYRLRHLRPEIAA